MIEAVVARMPPPRGDPAAPLKALIIDSWFDNYVGVVMLVRVVDGVLAPKDKIRLMSTQATYLCEQVGVFTPKSVQKAFAVGGRGGFRDRRDQGAEAAPRSATRSRWPTGRPSRRCPASRRSSRRCSPGCTRSRPTSTTRCATLWRSCT